MYNNTEYIVVNSPSWRIAISDFLKQAKNKNPTIEEGLLVSSGDNYGWSDLTAYKYSCLDAAEYDVEVVRRFLDATMSAKAAIVKVASQEQAVEAAKIGLEYMRKRKYHDAVYIVSNFCSDQYAEKGVFFVSNAMPCSMVYNIFYGRKSPKVLILENPHFSTVQILSELRMKARIALGGAPPYYEPKENSLWLDSSGSPYLFKKDDDVFILDFLEFDGDGWVLVRVPAMEYRCGYIKNRISGLNVLS